MPIKITDSVVSADTVSTGTSAKSVARNGFVKTQTQVVLPTAVSDAIESALKQSEWINIPKVYLENSSLVVSILPFLILSALLILVDIMTAASPSTSPVSTVSGIDDLNTAISSLSQNDFSGFTSTSISDSTRHINHLFLQFLVDMLTYSAHIFEFAILVRLSKIIGTDRDKILALNILQIANEPAFRGKKIVVVNGMLHSNGIARYILSGLPTNETINQ